jgi:hypothetical protein
VGEPIYVEQCLSAKCLHPSYTHHPALCAEEAEERRKKESGERREE